MLLHAPQLIYLGLAAVAVGVNMAKHGEPRSVNAGIVTARIAAVTGLLWWGGFFS